MEIVVPKRNIPAPFMSIRDAATQTGLSQHYLRAGCKTGTVPHIMVGNQYRINVPLLLQQLDEQSRPAERSLHEQK